MHFNLLQERWLPVRLADDTTRRITPWEITGKEVPILELAPVRADFRSALYEFLIGLLQTTCPPRDVTDWEERLERPPDEHVLREAMLGLAGYFNLLGERPLFLQDLSIEPAPKLAIPVSALLIDAPAEFFIKPGQVDALCPACAAMALFTMQAFAPSGGRGNRTSLRGGGPLSTILLGDNLWKTLWLNVMPLTERGTAPKPVDADLPGNVFAWAAPTRTSEKEGSQIWPQDVHFLHPYWGMPRRYLLLPEQSEQPVPCSLCEIEGRTIVRKVQQRPHGPNYGDTWRHPLSPYRDQGADKPMLSIKGTAHITGYVHWLGLLHGDSGDVQGRILPARCLAWHARAGFLDVQDQARRLLASGYDVDNMKPRQWCEGELPIVAVPPGLQDDFRREIAALVQAANTVRAHLVVALKEAVYYADKSVSADTSRLANATTDFWGRTETAFYRTVSELPGMMKKEDQEGLLQLRQGWADSLIKEALEIFYGEAETGRFHPDQARRTQKALRKMKNFNRKRLRDILELPKDWRTS
ncbi:type I-E CRISPR-associated protein Cse1/CasA [Desulfonatronum thioautotrophicum]|uniref:type I-E CRISPR-associated protein Cse1/CasA n=1 Tax=Desulfonatronum thioautotrophicum TaxID=617001 RepID=UPI000699B664|nr:type I-E CRISPR-associated protein Cse1/CasA [Desulfonatronum thioautotrophicum]